MTTPDPAQDDTQQPIEPPAWMLDRITAEADLARSVNPQQPCPVCGMVPEVINSAGNRLVIGLCLCLTANP